MEQTFFEKHRNSIIRLKRFVLRPVCWWFGCEIHPDDPAPPEYALCVRCDRPVPYGHMVGDTWHRKTTYFLNYWCFRKWWPTKCGDCGRRFGSHEDCLPF